MKLHFLSGLPRSGSTLLTSLLYQNPLIHTEGVSGLCDLMWSAAQSVKRNQQWNGNPRNVEQLVRDIPSLYYKDVQRPVVIDKCRAWNLPGNIEMIKEFVTPKPKIICCVRNVADVEKSFVSLFARNGRADFYESPMFSELEMSLAGVKFALDDIETDKYLFVEYENIVNDTNSVLQEIYEFLNMEPFQHDLGNIVDMNPENDSVYGLEGMHVVRSIPCPTPAG